MTCFNYQGWFIVPDSLLFGKERKLAQTSPERAVSTWSLRRTLGNFIAEDSAVDGGRFVELPTIVGGLTLLEIIPELAKRGYTAIQIVHFHLKSLDNQYLDSVRKALQEHNITLDALLIDDGDLTADPIEPQLAWYDAWLEVADILGAKRARVCAGRSEPTPALLKASALHLANLASKHPNVRIVTENWMEMMPDSDSVQTVLSTAGDSVGLLIDLGNWSSPEKYDELARIAPGAETCHAKCAFTEDGPDEEDFRKSLSVLKDAGFNGPLALIYDGPDDDEWSALDQEWKIAQDVFK